MHNSRIRLAAVATFAALASSFGATMMSVPKALGSFMRSGPAPKSAFSGLYSSNIFKPHQSMRECARRVGGSVWELCKERDRMNRGLSPQKTRG
jgi:hypothetical protein